VGLKIELLTNHMIAKTLILKPDNPLPHFGFSQVTGVLSDDDEIYQEFCNLIQREDENEFFSPLKLQESAKKPFAN
jgi:hypothetical protein